MQVFYSYNMCRHITLSTAIIVSYPPQSVTDSEVTSEAILRMVLSGIIHINISCYNIAVHYTDTIH